MPDSGYISTDDNANFLKCRGPHRIATTGQAIEGPLMRTNITVPAYQLIPDRIKLVYMEVKGNLNTSDNPYLDKGYRQQLEELPPADSPHEVSDSPILDDLQWQETRADRYEYTKVKID